VHATRNDSEEFILGPVEEDGRGFKEEEQGGTGGGIQKITKFTVNYNAVEV
jgi:hypothetical protein